MQDKKYTVKLPVSSGTELVLCKFSFNEPPQKIKKFRVNKIIDAGLYHTLSLAYNPEGLGKSGTFYLSNRPEKVYEGLALSFPLRNKRFYSKGVLKTHILAEMDKGLCIYTKEHYEHLSANGG